MVFSFFFFFFLFFPHVQLFIWQAEIFICLTSPTNHFRIVSRWFKAVKLKKNIYIQSVFCLIWPKLATSIFVFHLILYKTQMVCCSVQKQKRLIYLQKCNRYILVHVFISFYFFVRIIDFSLSIYFWDLFVLFRFFFGYNKNNITHKTTWINWLYANKWPHKTCVCVVILMCTCVSTNFYTKDRITCVFPLFRQTKQFSMAYI